ncbi:hypothetical protein KDX25_04750 [Burkholderia cenocepacia]|uniref:hypothetical protein n=1 Tax=Burkholderia cenocepacia TaxID=95486 RepID=UPI000F56352E|nr:hypothetical protein [Burkholderia cenocepacia]MBR8305712.1 hypothetical protein [Burkholderia cenocepacia]RQU93526.1 hypothetical protein DF042_32645 [Burkholderia cenocepacia]
MPVDFSKLPPEELEPDKPPSRIVWTVVFFAIVLAAVVAVLLFWPKGESIRSRWFWICVTVYPVGVATFVVLRRYSVYEGLRLDAIEWKKAREKYINDVFEQASRPLAVVAATYRFASDSKEDSFDKLLDGSIKLEPRAAPKPDTPAANARWFERPEVDEGGDRIRHDDTRRHQLLEWVFGALIADIAEAVRALPPDLKMAIQLALPETVNADEALASWNKQWAKSDLRSLKAEILPEPLDLMVLDAWLDRINQKRDHEARLLVFVRLTSILQALPAEGSAEAGVALLVAPEPVQRKFKVRPIAWLHRPNEIDTCPVDVALARALRWGRVESAAVSRIWQSGLDLAAVNGASAAVVKAGIAAKPANIDYMVGHAGEVASWLGVTCAAKAAAQEGSVQLVVTASKKGPCFTVLRNIDPQ